MASSVKVEYNADCPACGNDAVWEVLHLVPGTNRYRIRCKTCGTGQFYV